MRKIMLAFVLNMLLSFLCCASCVNNIEEDATVTLVWNVFDANRASASRDINGTVKVRRSDDVIITAGITDLEDFPSTGMNECIIDTSTDGNYAPHYDYFVYVEGMVVEDGRVINTTIGQFSIDNCFTGTAAIDANSLADITVTHIDANSTAAADANLAAAKSNTIITTGGEGPWTTGGGGEVNVVQIANAVQQYMDANSTDVEAIKQAVTNTSDRSTVAGRIADMWLSSGAGGFP